MSWHTGSLVSTREAFALAALARREPFAQQCRRFRIVRSTGYKWLHRFRRAGRAGLSDLARRPKRSPHRFGRQWRLALRQLRRHHPTWGPRKLHARLRQLHPRVRLPVPRTIARWLQQMGLVPLRSRRQRRGPQLPPRRRRVARCANDIWTIDFKGWFRTGDGTRVEPLTVRDLKSRCLLEIRLLRNQSDRAVRRVLQRVFRRYGLPKVMRVDNGPPFGGVGPLGLSRLSVWWRRLGLRVEFSRPAHPQDNAAHEQMHRVYQAEVAARPAPNLRAQQRRSERWRQHYNQVRPHEALGLRSPALYYHPSSRRLPKQLSPWAYRPTWLQRRVMADGRLFWRGRQRFIGRAFGGEIIALQPIGTERWKIYLGGDLLGVLYQHDRSRSLRPAAHAYA
jgi:putative transposase